ncbi:MAG: 3-keto-5-aminohexanoate cleavage protein, partial [Alphaproteobacteria bacterium]|nr:3-keto-5-aminohexanoate cleavage protein [Alphaproteobacteria bacterium]MDX5370694.1 3-keto-5-aminohexanoate cleavage protein [Alphaproteobacteria bacterium]MDX5465115.1 3-keto-5-aminohexanoate cleavage protein [Alphaproteobacteria bacterium]
MTDATPAILSVAPNGARRTKADHPALPMTPADLAAAAVSAQAAGASLIHLHVRDADGRHTLDPGIYREATEEVRAAVGDGMIVQITTEAVGLYTPEQQIATVRTVRPEAASVALREIVPDDAGEALARDFYHWATGEGIHLQHILFTPEEVARFAGLCARG